MLRPYALEVDAAPAPIGIDDPEPAFGWKLRGRGFQRAHRSRVRADGPGRTGAFLWDSGTVPSEETLGIEYAGAPLRPYSRYRWAVAVRDRESLWAAARSCASARHFSEAADHRALHHGGGLTRAEPGDPAATRPLKPARYPAAAFGSMCARSKLLNATAAEVCVPCASAERPGAGIATASRWPRLGSASRTEEDRRG